MLHIIQVRYIGWDLFWVLFFFLGVVVVVTQQEEDGMTKAEIVKNLDHSWTEYTEHQLPELNACCSPMNVKIYQNGQRWLLRAAFAINLTSIVSITFCKLMH